MNLLYPTTYVVWDVETTGLDPVEGRIVEFAALIVEKGKVCEKKSFILNHGIDIPEDATRVHGLTKKICKQEGVKPDIALKWAIHMLSAYPDSVTHNGLSCDIPFLLQEACRFELLNAKECREFERYLYDTCVDTAVLYKARKSKLARYWNEPFAAYGQRVRNTVVPGAKYEIENCCDELGIDRSHVVQHRADGDVELTNEIYKKLTR